MFWQILSLHILVVQAYDFSALDALMQSGIEQRVFPGAVALISYRGEIVYERAVGNYTYDPQSPKIECDTLFDLASVTKVIVPTTIAMILCDAQIFALEDLVCKYLPEFGCNGKEHVRIKHLLTHTSGVDSVVFFPLGYDIEKGTHTLYTCVPVCAAGERFIYSSLNMILLGKVIESATGKSLDTVFADLIAMPLGMHDTHYNPQERERCAPTRYHMAGRSPVIQAEVHDNQAFMLNGVAGHAGLFSTARDCARLMKVLLNQGMFNGSAFIKPETIAEWTRTQCTSADHFWGYGWEIGRCFTPHSFGHYGWTGTSIWADPEHDLFCILLTNRTYPADDNFEIRSFREQFHQAVSDVLRVH